MSPAAILKSLDRIRPGRMLDIGARDCTMARHFVSLGYESSYQLIVALLCAVFAGGLLGYLPWNFNPARVFIGTTGVMVMGYLLAVLAILTIIAIVVGINAGRLQEVALAVVFATLLHNVSGLALGYAAARLMRFEPAICRTIALEVGMQNSGLATALALKFFSPAAALPGTLPVEVGVTDPRAKTRSAGNHGT